MPELDDLITTARDAYQRRDWNVANRNFTAALRQSQQGPAQLGPADLEGLADSAWWLGDVPESLAAAEELYRRQVSDGEPASAAMTAIVLALRWGTRGDLAVASGWLNRARRLLQGVTECPEAGYLLYLETAMSMDPEGDPAAAAEAAGKVEALSRRFADPALACFARVLSAIALVREGRTDAGFNDLDEAMLPVLAGDVAPEWAGDIYCTVVHLCHELGDLARMRAWTAALERWTAGLSSTFVYADVTRVHELQLLSAEGNWDAVEREIGPLSERLATSHGWMAGAGFYELGEIRRLRGDSAGAVAAYDRVRDTGVEPQPGEALLRAAAGDHDSALEHLGVALGESGDLEGARMRLAAAELAAAAGHQGLASAFCEQLEQTALRFASPGLQAWAAQARGIVHLGAGRPEEALGVLNTAARIYREQRARYSTARIHELMADCRAALGQPDIAAADRATALAIYRRLGAAPDARRLEGGSPGGLTARETEVLALVSGGASNRQVAESLVISEKTVRRHLANIFLKIGVTSRTGAAGWAQEHGLKKRPTA